jgi:hypothetical protein
VDGIYTRFPTPPIRLAPPTDEPDYQEPPEQIFRDIRPT